MARLLSLSFKTLFWTGLLIIPGFVLILFVWGIQSQPLAINEPVISQDHVNRAKHLLQEHDPRRLRTDEVYALSVNDRDINLVIGYLLKSHPQMAAKARVSHGSVTVQASLALQTFHIDGYLNIVMSFIELSDRLVIEDIAVGDVQIPNWLSRPFTKLMHKLLMQTGQYSAMVSAIEEYRFFENNLIVAYQWQPELARQIHETGKKLILSEKDTRRLIHYTNEIARLTYELPQKASLEKLLKPLYEQTRIQAMQRRKASDENRAMLIALTFYIMGSDVRKHFNIPVTESPVKPRRIALTLANRQDLATHFVLSAGITASAGKGIAEALGLFKELKDSKGGTGFSFADLAADKAGVHLAELSINQQTAANVQITMSEASSEKDFMPDIGNLPEGIQELVFNRRYIAVNDPAYLVIDNEINRRINNCIAFKL